MGLPQLSRRCVVTRISCLALVASRGSAGQGFAAEYRITNGENKSVNLLFAPEFNFAFSIFVTGDHGEFKGVTRWNRRDEHYKLRVEMNFSKEVDLNVFPLETVSLSEGGFERTYQGTVVMPLLRLNIPENGISEFRIEVKTGEYDA